MLSPLGFLLYYICVRSRPEIGNADLHATMGVGTHFRKNYF